MRTMWILGAALACTAAPSGVGDVETAEAKPAAKADAGKAEMQKARAKASKRVGEKDYKAAISLLMPLVDACSDGNRAWDAEACGWVASDLAVAYDRDGQFLECMHLMAPLSHPSSRVQQAGNSHLTKAIQFNLNHCSKGFDKMFSTVKPAGCALTIESIASAALPVALAPAGATAACVALVRGTRAKDAEPGDVTCPKLALVWKGAKGTVERKELKTSGDSDVVSDDSVCCNLSTVAAGPVAGKTLVRVKGHGRDCSGGTASTSSDVFYEWQPTGLAQTINASVGFH